MRVSRLTCFALVLITIVSYWGIQNHEFAHYGGFSEISQHQQVRAGLSAEGIWWAFTETSQPLTAISHMLDFDLYGSKAPGHHLTNLLLHVLNALLLLSVVSRMTGAFWPSAGVVAIFTIHPLQVESVAWVAARSTLLGTFFSLLTISAYLQYVTWRGAARYVVMAAFFSLVLATDSTQSAFLLALLLLDGWPLGRLHGQHRRGVWAQSSARQLAAEKAPLIAMAIIAAAALGWAQPIHTSIEGLPSADSDHRLAEAAVTYTSYIAKTVYPRDLAIFYSHPGQPLSVAMITACSALLALITAFALMSARQYPYLTVGWLWFLILLAPQIGVFPVSPPNMADHYAYVPLIGLLLAIIFGVSNATERWKHRRRVLPALLGIILLALLVATRDQVSYWQNSVTVWEHALQLNPENPIALRNTAVALERSGQSWEAIEHLRQAIAIAPEFVDARNRLGRELTNRGELVDANRQLTEALAAAPGNASIHYNLGRALFLQRKAEETIHHFEQALAIQADHLDAHRGLGVVLAQERRYEEAAAHLQSVLDREPHDALSYFQLGVVQSKMDQLDAAIASVEKGLEIAPNTEAARRFLAELQTQKVIE